MKRQLLHLSILLTTSIVTAFFVPAYGQFSGPLDYSVITKKPECQKAKPAFKSASVIVYGDDLTDNDGILADWCTGAGSKMNEQYQAGFKFSDAVTYLKGRLIADTHTQEKARVIDRAYMEVMGRQASVTDSAYWQAKMRDEGKWWYATMVPEFVKYLNNTKAEREAAIKRAYQTALGREASKTDLEYWMPRTEHYRLIRDANRAWLYSASGAGELPEVINRAYKEKKGKTLTDAEMKAWATAFGGSKPTYEEMLKKI